MPYGPNRKPPASRSSRLPKTLGESNRGRHSQSTEPSGATKAPVWQSERNAKSAIGGNGDGSVRPAATRRPRTAVTAAAQFDFPASRRDQRSFLGVSRRRRAAARRVDL